MYHTFRSASTIAVCLLIFSFSFATVSAQHLGTLSGNFELTLESNNKHISRGRIYYASPDRLLMIVSHPIDQILLYGENMLKVYYPESDSLLEFEDSNIRNVSFFYGFLRALTDKLDATESGFEFKESHFENDSLFLIYEPPREHQNSGLEMTNVYYGNRLIYNYVHNTNKDQIIARSDYENYQTINGFEVPKKITIKFFTDGLLSYSEQAEFSDININGDFNIHELLPKKMRQQERL